MKKILVLFLFFIGLSVKAQPVLQGGLDAFIRTNIIYPVYSLQNCIQGKINISFKVNLSGEVYTSKVSSGLGIDLDQEALRLIRLSSGKWQVPDNYDTTYVLIAPVNFILSDGDCATVNPQQRNKAIAAYKANEGLTEVITNFYRNKAIGNYNEAEEGRITALKKELGYDDSYLEKRIEEGKKRLKQKDKQGACEDFLFVKYMGSSLADELLEKYCK
ncbi:energy transducer TonB [Pedobacter lusitanus]|uniref:Energy transducer TonB n=1 Tax=Pedobacter lusitanus TaxID=1503925 RepID=A0A0D0FUV6_9SPHI|nr:energy transducer TonB [Pedobacter lusitanus]KIO76234.1 energy transducer TonB [Pedobacter lusitanus]